MIMSFTAFSKVITVPKNADGGWYYPNGGFPAKAGDTVYMEGNYAYVNIKGLVGAANAPVSFLQKPGAAQAWVGTNNTGYAWVMMDGKYFVIDGIKIGGPTPTNYSNHSLNLHGSDEFTINNCEILNAKIGLFSNLNNRHYNNIRITNNYIHNISDAAQSNFSESIYFGPTDGTSLLKASFRGLVIKGNRFENIGGDAIQVANGIKILVADNTIKNYGFHNIGNQRSGILFGGHTSGIAENNYLEGGTGCPFNILGRDTVIFRNNTAIGTAKSPGQDGFYIRETAPLKVWLTGNDIDKVARNWVNNESNSALYQTGNAFGELVVIPPVTQPQPTVPQAQYDSLLAKYQVAVQLLNACVSLREECYQKNKELNLTIDSLNIRVAELEAWKEETIKYVNRK